MITAVHVSYLFSYLFCAESFLRQVIEGLDFLRKNKLYHGNLNWDLILYLQPSTVKLANFRKQGKTYIV